MSRSRKEKTERRGYVGETKKGGERDIYVSMLHNALSSARNVYEFLAGFSDELQPVNHQYAELLSDAIKNEKLQAMALKMRAICNAVEHADARVKSSKKQKPAVLESLVPLKRIKVSCEMACGHMREFKSAFEKCREAVQRVAEAVRDVPTFDESYCPVERRLQIFDDMGEDRFDAKFVEELNSARSLYAEAQKRLATVAKEIMGILENWPYAEIVADDEVTKSVIERERSGIFGSDRAVTPSRLDKLAANLLVFVWWLRLYVLSDFGSDMSAILRR